MDGLYCLINVTIIIRYQRHSVYYKFIFLAMLQPYKIGRQLREEHTNKVVDNFVLFLVFIVVRLFDNCLGYENRILSRAVYRASLQFKLTA